MAESTAVGKSGKKEDIKIKSTIEFFKTQYNSFRAEMCEISGVPYVAIVKFWQPENCDHFVPTKKGIFLTWHSGMLSVVFPIRSIEHLPLLPPTVNYLTFVICIFEI